jgi:hypothetical protein
MTVGLDIFAKLTVFMFFNWKFLLRLGHQLNHLVKCLFFSSTQMAVMLENLESRDSAVKRVDVVFAFIKGRAFLPDVMQQGSPQ